MRILLSFFLSLISTLFLASCGQIASQALDENANVTDPASIQVFLFGTDFMSAGQVYSAPFEDANLLTNTGLANLGSSATIKISGGRLLILHDGYSVASADNIQVIDAQTLTTISQFSTGSGTNPHDVVVIDDLAYISLYNPEGNGDRVDEQGNPADVIVMDLDTGAIVHSFSFKDYLQDDGQFFARADKMELVGDRLFVCLQDLGPFFEQEVPGKIAVINTTSRTVERVISLKGRNPVDLVYSESEDRLFVALQAPYDFALGNFDVSTDFGGVEIVPLEPEAETILIPDQDLGGYIERLALGNGRVLAVASTFDPATFVFSSTILSMNESASSQDDVSVFIEGSSDVREMVVDPLDRLWVSRRAIKAGDGSASDPQVEIFSLEDGSALGQPLIPEVPVIAIAFGQ